MLALSRMQNSNVLFLTTLKAVCASRTSSKHWNWFKICLGLRSALTQLQWVLRWAALPKPKQILFYFDFKNYEVYPKLYFTQSLACAYDPQDPTRTCPIIMQGNPGKINFHLTVMKNCDWYLTKARPVKDSN